MHHLHATANALRSLGTGRERVSADGHVEVTIVNESTCDAIVAGCLTYAETPAGLISAAGGYTFLRSGESELIKELWLPQGGCDLAIYAYYRDGRFTTGGTRFWIAGSDFTIWDAIGDAPKLLTGRGPMSVVTGEQVHLDADHTHRLHG